MDDHSLQKKCREWKSKSTPNNLTKLSMFVGSHYSSCIVDDVENRLSSTGSTASSVCESWPFAYRPMAYGLVDDHSLQNTAGNGSHNQHPNTRVALLFALRSKGEFIPLWNPSDICDSSIKNQHLKTEIQRQESGHSDDEKQTTGNMAPHASSRMPCKAKICTNTSKSLNKCWLPRFEGVGGQMAADCF
ncbi:hypothetical protein FO488_00220 [Geobacter sp. FeAm09]|uniref:hypothetical protein n=1 Tax=Geobacter sp. FeAm09 TaxID=2597769 RepID=UPI0011EBE2A1|nr:hypothetical protein [Geobacter sp. FeAm09]QEM66733.1 hypothetical protein FO488_00220 [Geobacter sp. FeAm09]